MRGKPASVSMSTALGTTEPVGRGATEDVRAARILIVHGAAPTRATLARGLPPQTAVVEAAGGRVALERVAAQPIDLILLDFAAPEVDGPELLTQLKADPRFWHIPVIMIVTVAQCDGVASCLEAGAEDYLCEPYHPALLRIRVDAALENKWLRDNEKVLHDAMTESRLSHEKLLQEALVGAKQEIAQLQETIKVLRRQLDSTTATAKAGVDAARTSAAAELRQLRATVRGLREQLDTAISEQSADGAAQPPSERRKGASDRRKGKTGDGR
jgi:response regulator RpfG family c-di-GMP phosphodiesterase